jgi:release factor glutamine methyltransferase
MKENPISSMYDPAQVYQPEADTYLLLEAAQSGLRPGDRVLEAGTGSGYIAGNLTGCDLVVATDINPHAIRAAKERGVEVMRADLLDGTRGPFDLVIFNPPYLPTRDDEKIDDWFEYALDGGPDGRAVINRFANDVGRVLAPGGRVLLLISSLTGVEKVVEIFESLAYRVEILAKRRVYDEDIIVIKCSKRKK